MNQKLKWNMDKAGREFWEKRYIDDQHIEANWQPSAYNDIIQESLFRSLMEKYNPESILEVGCGGSNWIPYLLKHYAGITCNGLDYSEEGCDLLRKKLVASNLNSKIFCADLFKIDEHETGQYDLVYSLGVVEHYKDLENILQHLLKLVKPGGVLMTAIPNLRSVHGLIMWIYQPDLFFIHKLISKRKLKRKYKKLGLEHVKGKYLGYFSMNITQWENKSRFKFFDKHLSLRMKRLSIRTDKWLIRKKKINGSAMLAPIIYIIGEKKTI